MDMTQETIKELIELRTENKNLDYKEKFNWNEASKPEKCGLIKDILAMFNTKDGGRIVFGVKDKTYEFVGLSDEDYKSFDPTSINDLLHECTDPQYSCSVYKHVIDDKNTVLIDVPEYKEIPIICKGDICDTNGKNILKRGSIYIRTEKATSQTISSSTEMREFLGRAITKKGDELLFNIESLLKGKPLTVSKDIEATYSSDIKDANIYIDKTIGESIKTHGAWEVCAYPIPYTRDLFPTQISVRDNIRNSEVSLRGWNYPHTDKENSYNFSKGHQSYTTWFRHHEAYRAYQNGLFVWKKVLKEDVEGRTDKDKKTLSFVNTIWSITEYLLFLKRYYESLPSITDVHYRISLDNANNRILTSQTHNAFLFEDYVSYENLIPYDSTINIAELRTDYKSIANNLIRRIFQVFNLNDVPENVIDDWQTKLIEKTY